ncbi:SDR family NAD(P)-dependent oxidoreductase [Yinghuangia sp. YIM S09857]|uniref:SDR family NAD(P)-dependent oxidoreductase n=1 Tax=Yinghuangia sp. YIM S09857 TaxID=3436929 RepID=UPI003F52B538
MTVGPVEAALSGKCAVVTGASRGIGRATAVALARAGASVVLAARDEVALKEAAAEVAEARRQAYSWSGGDAADDRGVADRGVADGEMADGEVAVVVGDICDGAHRQEIVDTAVARFGSIDILVNNVGGGTAGGITELDADGLNAAFHLNVTTAYDMTRRALPNLREGDGGSVVMMSSRAASSTGAGRIAYGTAKAALSHLTRLLATELAPLVRVNAIEPGPVDTGLLTAALTSAEVRAVFDGIPMGRAGLPEEIAAAVVYLASPASAWTTGSVLRIDGGRP